MGSALPIALLGALALGAPSTDLDDGIVLYRNKDFRGALAAFGRANAKSPSKKQRALIHVYIGIIQFRFGQVDDARNSFLAVLNHTSRVRFPDASQGGAQRLFEEVLRGLEPEPPPEKKRRKKRRRRKRRRSNGPSEVDVIEDIAVDDPPRATPVDVELPPPYIPPPAPPPLVTTVDDGPPPAAWVVSGVGAAAALAGSVFLIVAVHNGNASREVDRDALSAERLYGRYQSQAAIGVGGLAIAGVCAGVATYLFLAD